VSIAHAHDTDGVFGAAKKRRKETDAAPQITLSSGTSSRVGNKKNARVGISHARTENLLLYRFF